MTELQNGGTYAILAKPVDGSGNLGSLTSGLTLNLNPSGSLSIISNQTAADGSVTLTVKNQNGSPSNGTATLTTTGASSAGPLSDVEQFQIDGVPGPAPTTAIMVTATRIS